MTNKILVRVNSILDIIKYKKVNINNFLFALNGFSTYKNTFSLDEIKSISDNKYVLINRVLDNNDMKLLEKMDFEGVNGIVFEDVGVYELLKSKNIPLIWNQMHFAVSSNSVNFWLDRVYSTIISTDITTKEIENIVKNAKNNVIIPIFGYNIAMYSRRRLISHYCEYKGFKMPLKPKLSTNNINFVVYESEYGTVLYNSKPFSLLDHKFNDDKVLFYYVDPLELSSGEVIDILKDCTLETDNRFLLNKTIYKLEARK